MENIPPQFNPLEIQPLKSVSRIGGVYPGEYLMFIFNLFFLLGNISLSIWSFAYPDNFFIETDTYNQIILSMWNVLFLIRLVYLKIYLYKGEDLLDCFEIETAHKDCVKNEIKIFCYKTPSIVLTLTIIVLILSLIGNYTPYYLIYCIVIFLQIMLASAWTTTGDCLIGTVCKVYGDYINNLENQIEEVMYNIDLEANEGQTLTLRNSMSEKVQLVIDNYDKKFKKTYKMIRNELNLYTITHLFVVFVSFSILVYRAIYDKTENIKSIINIWMLTICFSSTPFTELLKMISLPGKNSKALVLKLKSPNFFLRSEQIWGNGEYLSNYIEEKDLSIKILGYSIRRNVVFRLLAGWAIVGGAFVVENFFAN